MVRWADTNGHHVGRVHFVGHYADELLYSIDEVNGARSLVYERFLASA